MPQMTLTNKVEYLLTEYNQNVKPIIDEILSYVSILGGLTTAALIGESFEKMSAVDKAATVAEFALILSDSLDSINGKIYTLAKQVETKAQNLITNHEDHVVGMTENVNDDANINSLTAQTQSLSTSSIGMAAITPGGGAGSAVVDAENAKSLVTLASEVKTKATQIQEAAADIPQLELLHRL